MSNEVKVRCCLKVPAVGDCCDVSKDKDNQPLVSILIPAYNAERWVADAIRSALEQTWEPKEIFVVDDGSSDRTLEIARQFGREGVRVATQQNRGASAARNLAFSMSKGSYIQWLDADDLLDADKIARQMEARSETGKTLLSGAWAEFMLNPRRAQFEPTSLWCDLSPIEWMMRKLADKAYMINSSWLVSRELTLVAGPWDTTLSTDDDGEYFCRVLMASEGVRFVPGAKAYYRTHRLNTLSHAGSDHKKTDSLWLSQKLHIQYLRSMDDSPRVRQACLQYLRNYLICYFPERSDIVVEAQQLACELGEPLGLPRLDLKYRWIRRFCGWRAMKAIQRSVSRVRRWVDLQTEEALDVFSGCYKAMPHQGNRGRSGVASKLIGLIPFVVCFHALHGQTAAWTPILDATRAINWSNSGVGTIPARPIICASLTPSATVAQINAALATCPREQTVYLKSGIYLIDGGIRIPSHVTLRGAGPDQTILEAVGSGFETAISMGDGWVSYHPVSIRTGAVAGATDIELANTSGVRVGSFLVITEINDTRYVSSDGSEGTRNWTDAEWTKSGTLARGQIVEVTGVAGDHVRFASGLYSSYTIAPVAVPFSMSAQYAGVENLQVYAMNSGYQANFGMSACAYCWIKGVESNYADGDHVRVHWGFRDEVRDSYFSNAFQHRPGTFDSDIRIAFKTSASLVENNIIERTHQAVLVQYGPAGNVIAYNYSTGAFDSGAPNFVVGGIFFHGAHPQFNLLEGNVVTKIDHDSTWGTSSDTTIFRNWVVGTNKICIPLSGRGVVNCSGPNGHYGFQSARAIQMSYLATRANFVGNVVGSVQMQSLSRAGKRLAQVPRTEYPALRDYENAAYGWSFGYGKESDDGTGTGCSGGSAPCHLGGTSSTDFFHGNYTNADESVAWAAGVPHQLPASFYLSQKPSWWGDLPFPATGPDVSGGPGPKGHSYGNPAQACYLKVMGGSDGGTGSPLKFNADKCYPPLRETR